VKPFATKVSMAGFFVRQDGSFPQVTPQEFPLRRRELTGEDPPPRRSLMERSGDRRSAPATCRFGARSSRGHEAFRKRATVSNDPAPTQRAATAPAQPLFRGGWVWIPLSFVFLLLGVLLGFQSAMTIGTRSTSKGCGGFLSRTNGDAGRGQPDREMESRRPAVRAAQKGLLEIEDGGYAKPGDLDQAHLQGGSIIYRNSSNTVRFRLVVYLNGRLTVIENIEWKQ